MGNVERTSGVYKITSPNGKVYVGSSKDLKGRAMKHRSTLKRNAHKNPKLQNSWNKYGKFVFEPIYFCEESELEKWEQVFINEINPSLNILKIAYSSKGYKHTEETKKEIGEATRQRLKKNDHLQKYRYKVGGPNPSKKGLFKSCHKAVAKPVILTKGDKKKRFRSILACANAFRTCESNVRRRLDGCAGGVLKGWKVEYA